MELYQNPLRIHADFADPFVLRHGGKYYLYCTTEFIDCYVSDDLLSWRLIGHAIEPETFPALVPFAPEVTYFNGTFYMYTSPHGKGHYVLTSDSPTGPFKKITENIGYNIDGSVFIDDDGQWYFYWAHEDGIMCCRMHSPTEFGESHPTGAYLHGWTEGPMVVKENGRYYMTYTGNHYLSKGYRIHLASSDNPLTGFSDCGANPVVVSTTEQWNGLGHNSIVLGPDLLTRYLVYHNMSHSGNRLLNLDAIVFGRYPRVFGPTDILQPRPALPDFCVDTCQIHTGPFRVAYAHGLLGGSGAAEFHLKVVSGEGTYGVEIGQTQITFTTGSNRLTITAAENEGSDIVSIPFNYNHNVLHGLLIRCHEGSTEFVIDGINMGKRAVSLCLSGTIAYFSNGPDIETAFTALSAGSVRRAAEARSVPVPCRIPLAEYPDSEVRLNVPHDGKHFLALHCQNIGGETVRIVAAVDGVDAGLQFVAASADIALFSLELPKGMCRLSLQFSAHLNTPHTLDISRYVSPAYVRESIHRLGPFDKKCLGEMSPAAFEASLCMDDCALNNDASASIIFRASHLSDGGEGEDKELGTNFFIGYSANMNKDGISLTKHQYDETVLVRKPVRFKGGTKRRLRVSAKLNDIEVFLGTSSVPILQYHDTTPILFGQQGIRVQNQLMEVQYDSTLSG